MQVLITFMQNKCQSVHLSINYLYVNVFNRVRHDYIINCSRSDTSWHFVMFAKNTVSAWITAHMTAWALFLKDTSCDHQSTRNKSTCEKHKGLFLRNMSLCIHTSDQCVIGWIQAESLQTTDLRRLINW